MSFTASFKKNPHLQCSKKATVSHLIKILAPKKNQEELKHKKLKAILKLWPGYVVKMFNTGSAMQGEVKKKGEHVQTRAYA